VLTWLFWTKTNKWRVYSSKYTIYTKFSLIKAPRLLQTSQLTPSPSIYPLPFVLPFIRYVRKQLHHLSHYSASAANTHLLYKYRYLTLQTFENKQIMESSNLGTKLNIYIFIPMIINWQKNMHQIKKRNVCHGEVWHIFPSHQKHNNDWRPNAIKLALYVAWGREGWTRGPENHRGLSSTLYMAKPSMAHTVAPALALNQKVELFRSACLTCL